jgi:ADP-ribose pyrophosphatase YjhB (NUDIX family)
MARTDGRRWRIGASGAVVHGGQVLLVRHTYGEKERLWALPGGYAIHDERLDQTAVREIREETGLEVEVMDVIGLRTWHTERGGAVFVLFRMRFLGGQPAPDGTEVDRVGWFSGADIAALSDDELMPVARNAALAALEGGPGLPEDVHLPGRDESYRSFLVGCESGDG